MATNFSVNIELEDNILKTLNQGKYSLCIQKYVDDGDEEPVANIVAGVVAPGGYSNGTKFKWNNVYTMAATNVPYKEGGYLTSTKTKALAISTQSKDAFILTDWATYKVVNGNASAPENGFAFLPGQGVADPGAMAVVHLASFSAGGAPGTPIPIYMSPTPCIGPSVNKLVPVEKVVIFFYKHARSGSMISNSRAFEQVIDLTEKPKQSWKLTDHKTWVEVNQVVVAVA